MHIKDILHVNLLCARAFMIHLLVSYKEICVQNGQKIYSTLLRVTMA